MNLKRTPFWVASVGSALVFALSPLACNGGSSDPDSGGDAGSPGDDDSGGSGGKGSGGKGSGGKGSGGKGSGGNGNPGGADGGDVGGGANPGAGGGSNPSASIDDLIQALCESEFNCCDDGELSYRLGSVGESVESCVDYFTFQLHESNSTTNPFPPGAVNGLLSSLAFTIDLSNVTENGASIGACTAQWESYECPTLGTTAPTYCAGTVLPGDDPCNLNNLFKPALNAGERCTIALAEGGMGNDVECKPGTTCLAPGVDNTSDFPICVQRGIGEQPCTADDDCDFNFYCGGGGKCAEKGDVGDDCSFKDSDEPIPGEEDASCLAGLKCSPDTTKCVANCHEDYPCVANIECPKNFVCAPATFGDDSTSWHTCQATGEDAEARCDSGEDADCVSNRYCDGSVCQRDVASDEACSRDAMCDTGLFCDLAATDALGGYRYATNQCKPFILAGEPCFPELNHTGCGSKAQLCLLNVEESEYQCYKALRKAGEDCNVDGDCVVGLACETTDLTATWTKTCTAGAEEGDECDSDTADDEKLDCGAGLLCVEGECVEQKNPGSDCEKDGAADASICKNSACVENWNENGPNFVCSDAPVPESQGGDGLTCGE